MAETKYKRNKERHVKPTRLLVQLPGSGNYGSNEFQPAENISRYINKKLSLIRTRYRKLFLLTNSLDNPEKVEKELKMVLTDPEFIKQDELVIRRINEAEGLLIDRMWNFGGTKDGDSNELSSSLYIISNLKQSLLEMQKIRKEHGDIRKNLQNFNEDYHIIYNAFMKSREISVIRNIAKNSHINIEPVSVYGESDKESAFSFYNYDEATNKNRFIKTEIEDEYLRELLNNFESSLNEYINVIEEMINKKEIVSTDSKNNDTLHSIKDILILSCGIEKGISIIADEICYFRQRLKFAEETVRCAKVRKMADLAVLEKYKRILSIKEKTIENLIGYGVNLDNKLAELKRYRKELILEEKHSDDKLLSDKIEDFLKISCLYIVGDSEISRRLSMELMEEPYCELKDVLISKIASDDKLKNYDIAELLKVIENKEDNENDDFEVKTKTVQEIAENPAIILAIIETLKTGKDNNGRILTNDEIIKLNKIMNESVKCIKISEQSNANGFNGKSSQNSENQGFGMQ